jgi:Flp pilus assembly protein TadG
MIQHRLRSDKKGSTTVEFALVSLVLCLVFAAILETGILWWLKSGMQLTASMTARCGAIGYTYGAANFPCTSTSTTQNYAVVTSQSWLLPNMITTANVVVNGPVSNCNGLAGSFFSVTLTSSYFSFLPPPLGGSSPLMTSACFPMSGS